MGKARFDLKRRLGMYNLEHGGKRKRQVPGIGRITHISTLAMEQRKLSVILEESESDRKTRTINIMYTV